MTAVDVDALDAARAAATPGEWTAATAPSESSDETHVEYLANGLRPDEGRPLWVAWAAKVPGVHDDEDDAYVVPVVTGDGPTSEANAAYIVAMHAALPDLLAEVRRGRALRERLEGLADDLRLEAPEQEAWDGNCIAAYEDISDRIRAATLSASNGQETT